MNNLRKLIIFVTLVLYASVRGVYADPIAELAYQTYNKHNFKNKALILSDVNIQKNINIETLFYKIYNYYMRLLVEDMNDGYSSIRLASDFGPFGKYDAKRKTSEEKKMLYHLTNEELKIIDKIYILDFMSNYGYGYMMARKKFNLAESKGIAGIYQSFANIARVILNPKRKFRGWGDSLEDTRAIEAGFLIGYSEMYSLKKFQKEK